MAKVEVSASSIHIAKLTGLALSRAANAEGKADVGLWSIPVDVGTDANGDVKLVTAKCRVPGKPSDEREAMALLAALPLVKLSWPKMQLGASGIAIAFRRPRCGDLVASVLCTLHGIAYPRSLTEERIESCLREVGLWVVNVDLPNGTAQDVYTGSYPDADRCTQDVWHALPDAIIAARVVAAWHASDDGVAFAAAQAQLAAVPQA